MTSQEARVGLPPKIPVLKIPFTYLNGRLRWCVGVSPSEVCSGIPLCALLAGCGFQCLFIQGLKTTTNLTPPPPHPPAVPPGEGWEEGGFCSQVIFHPYLSWSSGDATHTRCRVCVVVLGVCVCSVVRCVCALCCSVCLCVVLCCRECVCVVLFGVCIVY